MIFPIRKVLYLQALFEFLESGCRTFWTICGTFLEPFLGLFRAVLHSFRIVLRSDSLTPSAPVTGIPLAAGAITIALDARPASAQPGAHDQPRNYHRY
jgi:hypothetical protein